MQTGTEIDHDVVRRAILEAALTHVPFDGWSQPSLNAGARDAGYDATMVVRVFPGGPIDAIVFWSTDADRRMLAELAELGVAQMKVRERIATAIRLRLQAVAPHREALRRALGVLALPHNAPRGAELTWRTVDAIWWAAGDTATDWNFYSKRALLTGVYGTTLLRFLDDRSEGSAESWAFLDRRIADVMRIPKALAGAQRQFSRLPNPLALLRGRPFAR
jgi:ubiquinone biosynthesis protein COQ9